MKKIKDFGMKLESSGEATLRDIFTQAGLNSDLTERAIKDYQRYRESELSSLSILSGNDIRQIGAEALTEKVMSLMSGGEIVEEILIDYLRYLNYKKQIAETYQESKDWGVVFSTSVYSDVKEAQEAFIDYVEETYQTKVKDGKHLQKLTGIKAETLEGELLKIKPKEYGLPEKWNNVLGSDQYRTILWVLSFKFLINEPGSLMLLPDLRSIAQEIQAPYSVLMDCYKLTNMR